MATSDNKMADTDDKIFIGKGEQPVWLTLGLANRHGLVTGATGTGKTVSLQVMAEGFARAGVPVFAADIKGDLSGISEVGEMGPLLLSRMMDLNDVQEGVLNIAFVPVVSRFSE
jgi:DNA helicase HerA-like ATPase